MFKTFSNLDLRDSRDLFASKTIEQCIFGSYCSASRFLPCGAVQHFPVASHAPATWTSISPAIYFHQDQQNGAYQVHLQARSCFRLSYFTIKWKSLNKQKQQNQKLVFALETIKHIQHRSVRRWMLPFSEDPQFLQGGADSVKINHKTLCQDDAFAPDKMVHWNWYMFITEQRHQGQRLSNTMGSEMSKRPWAIGFFCIGWSFRIWIEEENPHCHPHSYLPCLNTRRSHS